MDADGVTLACATAAELRAARRARVRSALVGLRAANGVPEGPLVSFGLAGALRDGLPAGTVLDATRVVDGRGEVLWEGEALGVPGGRPATILAAEAIVDSAEERRRLHEQTGADAADLESGPLARTGRLRGILRVVSDTPERPLSGIEAGAKPEGGYDWRGLVRAFVRRPRGFARAASDARHALGRLAAAAEGWSR
jgi:hypothetical protein